MMADAGRRVAVALPVLILAVAGAAALLSRRGGADQLEIDPALVVTAHRTRLTVDVVEVGKVQPRQKIEIKSKVSGQVRSVMVEPGDAVHKGELLIRLDTLDSRRQLERAQVDVATAKSALKLAERTLNRRQRGFDVRAVSGVDVEVAVGEVETRQLALKLAKVAERAAVDQLRYTRIVSPIDGTVIERGIGPGEVVTPGVQATFEGRALMAIADLSTLLVRVEVNQIDVAKLSIGQTATVTLDALPGRSFEARLSRIAPSAIATKDKQVDVFPVEVTLRNAVADIKPGMVADVRIHVDARVDALVLPVEALVDQGGAAWVTAIENGPDGKPVRRLRQVGLGIRNDRDAEIVSGIRDGARVLVRPPSAADNEAKI